VIDDPLTPEVGVLPTGDGKSARWRVWASKANRGVELVLDPAGVARRIAMGPEGHGYYGLTTPTPEVGTRYAYAMDGGEPLPDPASRWQPEGTMKPSAVYFPERFEWDEGGWAGVARADLVFYELHVGTFTPEGTFAAVVPRLDALRDLGVTAVELMPVAQFPGVRSWGYDGVHPLAVQHSYGGPEGLQKLVAACHRKGLAVFLDAIFNHFGPDGLVLTEFGDYLTERTKTDWGPAVNYDDRGCGPVRALTLQGVRQWVRDYRFDGLRVDAADQIYDRGPSPVLGEITRLAHDEGARLGRPVHLFAETDLNDAPKFLHDAGRGGYGFDGHWNDEFHHALHVVLTGESNGYYADFADGPASLAKVLRSVFRNDGGYSEFRGRRHGAPATEFPGDRFVAFAQNHDQVGNRAKSDRYAASLPASAARLAAGVVLLAPRLPLLFMGEEYGETNPFPFFCDLQDPEKAEAVREGRRAEFASFGWTETVPDPTAAATRDLAVLSWSWADDPRRAGLRRLYAGLLRLRRELPGLRDRRHARAELLGDRGDLLEVTRGGATVALFNLRGEIRPVPERHAGRIPAFRSEVAEYGGPGGGGAELLPHEFAVYDGPGSE